MDKIEQIQKLAIELAIEEPQLAGSMLAILGAYYEKEGGVSERYNRIKSFLSSIATEALLENPRGNNL